MADIKIDKSRYTPEELAEYERLIAKATVDPEAAEDEMEDEVPPVPPKKTEKKEDEEMMKSDTPATPDTPEVPEFVKNAIAKSEEFMTRQEKKEMAEVAKKYSILGQNPDELSEQLYNLKKSDPAMYESSIKMMDDLVATMEKSGVFAEIGKSAGTGAPAAGNAVAKAEAKAAEIMKANPNMGHTEAIAKAWEDPSLMAEYDAEYFTRK